MKIRKGFVSNSSSSSYIVDCRGLSNKTIQKIYNYIDVTKNDKRFEQLLSESDDSLENNIWKITPFAENAQILFCETTMDNLPFYSFLKINGIEGMRIISEDHFPYLLLRNILTPHEELDAFISSSRKGATGVSFYLITDPDSDEYFISQLMNHIEIEMKKNYGVFEYNFYEDDGLHYKWDVKPHKDCKHIFLCSTDIGNKFDLIFWCEWNGFPLTNILFYCYYEEKPLFISSQVLEEIHLKKLSALM